MKKCNITDCQSHALNKGGFCLSENYINSTKKLLWQCSEGHKWEATWNNVKNNNHWCKKCFIKNNSFNRLDIKILQDLAISKNGKLLSLEYINNYTNMLWQCEKGHQWEATLNCVKDKQSWCPICMYGIPDITELQKFAISKNGKLLSTKYTTARLNLLWECELNHQWNATWTNVKDQNSWCPECSAFKTENKCRELLEQKLGFKFIKTRFNYNNQQLEFDGYNKENKIAFEYNGIQHYEFPNYWHDVKMDFERQKQYDDLKKQYAIENNIELIIIPYTESNNLEEYIQTIYENYSNDHSILNS
jgi:hypothetical protein